MDQTNSRRKFMQKIGLASSGLMLFSSTNVLNAFNDTASPFAGYNPYAESKTDLRASKIFGNHITIQGKVFDKDLVPIKNVKLEVWHLSPNSTKYRHQAKLLTNDTGDYSFVTDFPGREPGKMSRIYFKVSTGQASYSTELLLSDSGSYITGDHWEKNQGLKDLLQPTRNQSDIQFNLAI